MKQKGRRLLTNTASQLVSREILHARTHPVSDQLRNFITTAYGVNAKRYAILHVDFRQIWTICDRRRTRVDEILEVIHATEYFIVLNLID